MSGGVWIVSYVLLWVTVIALGLTVVVLLRQIGLLHTRIAPMGVNFAGEGPAIRVPAETTAPLPIVTPGSNTAPAPITACSPILILLAAVTPGPNEV